MGKFGKGSCCGRGGSWFKNCGSHGNAKLAHTWFEGIQACKASPEQSKLALGQLQLNPAQQNRYHSSNDVGISAEVATTTPTPTKAPIPTPTTTTVNMLIITSVSTWIVTLDHTSMTNASTHMLPPSTTHSSSSMSIITQGFEALLKTVVHTGVLLLIVC